MSHTTGVTGGTPGRQGVIIDVDEDIYALITRDQGEGVTSDDVVRRLLGMPPAA